MPSKNQRIKREKETIKVMITRYCRDQHSRDGYPCDECRELLDYALVRLSNCPFQENKTTCGNCPIHCYKPNLREKIRKVMRFSGPRMIYRHPLMAIRHIIDGFRKKPIRP